MSLIGIDSESREIKFQFENDASNELMGEAVQEYDGELFIDEVSKFSTRDLTAIYNATTGANLTKFSTKADAISRIERTLVDEEIPFFDAALARGVNPKASAAIAETWKDPDVRKRRVERHAAKVNGQVFKSVPKAFEALGLPMNDVRRFREATKATKSLRKTYKHEGVSYRFQLVPRSELF